MSLPAKKTSPAEKPKLPQRTKLPPMLLQYIDYKEDYPDCLLLFQVGDFYELFFEDAVTVSRALNLTLTSRDKNSPNPIPMCGVPIAVVDGYIDRLVDLGHSVAIVSQCSAPTPGKMVERKLERIITPAVRVMGSSEGNPTTSALIAGAIYSEFGDGAIVYGEVESGVLTVVEPLSADQLLDEIRRLSPLELVVPDEIAGKRVDRRSGWVKQCERSYPKMKIRFRGERKLKTGQARDRDYLRVKGYSALGTSGKKATKLLLKYIDETTAHAQVEMSEVRPREERAFVSIDATTRRNLELLTSLKDGSTDGTLFGYLHRTVSPGGTRLLRSWILQPLIEIEKIEERQSAVRSLKQDGRTRRTVRERLEKILDLERIAARIELRIASPRELASLRDSLEQVPDLKSEIEKLRQADSSSVLLAQSAEELNAPEELLSLLSKTLVDNPPQVLVEGGYIRGEHDEELARLLHIRAHGKEWLTELEVREREATGIPTLKVKFNNVLGYFLEVTSKHKDGVPEHYVRRQSMANAERFTTPELKAREQDILGAKSKQLERERELYEELKNKVLPFTKELRELHNCIAQLDILAAFAEIAEKTHCIQPELVEDPILELEKGKHPILAEILGNSFIPNDALFDRESRRSLILTGPNMGGKSTYLRQTALLTLLAHLGAFVPAERMKVGVVDRVFARLGASDDIAEGESTFMVEMKEAALILSLASKRSLVLIDEIGRGTATDDGLALAQAILEWITHRLSCRCLFATHFHELTELTSQHQGLKNISVGSTETRGEVVFTHEICEGPADRSYGLEVAKLAHLPEEVLERARSLLSGERPKLRQEPSNQLSLLYEAPQVTYKEPEDYQALKTLEQKVLSTPLNETTPIEALQILADAQKLFAR